MKTTKPRVQLVGENGNVFAIIGKVAAALRKAGQSDKAKEFEGRAFKAASYDDVLTILFDYVEPY